MDPEAVLEDCVVEVGAESYAIVSVEQPHSSAFATIDDGRERTQVIAERHLETVAVEKCSRGWARLTFDVVLPFELVGFLARVAGALAEADVSVFALSAYSTDHVLVRREQLETASETLTSLGCVVRHEADR